MKTIEEIREAFHRIHRRACGDSNEVYMSIPADRKRDADFVVGDAIDELEAARKEIERLSTAIARKDGALLSIRTDLQDELVDCDSPGSRQTLEIQIGYLSEALKEGGA